jgi:D-alanyl-D-alanine carboxypeptidase (penicillin-binding protein 5/6)
MTERTVWGNGWSAGRSRRMWRAPVAMGLAILAFLSVAGSVEAARVGRARALLGPKPGAPVTTAWIVVNAATGEVLASQEPDRRGAPASMTKMMLALVVLEAIKEGQLKLDDPVKTSRLASKMGGSQVYLKEGEAFSVEELMAALLIGSANDAAAALAERLTGSVEATVKLMNDRAATLKLSQTRFGSVHGLPPGPGQEGDIATPRDMARLGQALLQFPDALRWTGTAEAPFRGGSFVLRNSNKLVGSVAGVDGLKTGHFTEAGYNVAATAKRGNLRVIAVVMGAPTNQARFAEAARLLGEAFASYTEVTVAKAGTPVGEELRLPRARIAVRPVVERDVQVMVRRDDRGKITSHVEIESGLQAPLPRGHRLGSLVVRLGDKELLRASVVAPAEIRRSPFWWLTPWK